MKRFLIYLCLIFIILACINSQEVNYFSEVYSYTFSNYERENIENRIKITPIGFTTENTFNSAFPHGMNDGSFWQGRGFNTFLSGGLKLEYKNISLILFPELWYSQNKYFDLLQPANSQISEYGSFLRNIDQPQSMGNEEVFYLGLGETEFRILTEKITFGLGNQSLWIGPGKYNSIILSNNAGGFPKIDIGFRDVNIPWIGSTDLLIWWGYLTESKFFDLNSENDHRLFTGMHFSVKPIVIKNLTIGFNRTLLSDLSTAGFDSYTSLFIPFMPPIFGRDENDQRASITFNWLFPEIGFNVYFEWARNDYSPSLRFIIQFPQHTEAYSIGVNQRIYSNKNEEIILSYESTELLSSWDYTIDGSYPASFYTHHIVTHGYTQRGQLLGAGIGSGSNSQTLDLEYKNKDLSLNFYLQRIARSADYLFTMPMDSPLRDQGANNVEMTIGLSSIYFLSSIQSVSLALEYSRNLNWNFIPDNDINNFYINLKYSLWF